MCRPVPALSWPWPGPGPFLSRPPSRLARRPPRYRGDRRERRRDGLRVAWLRGSNRGHSGSGGGRSGARSTAGNGREGPAAEARGVLSVPRSPQVPGTARAVLVPVSPQVWISYGWSCGSIASGAWSFSSQCPFGNVTSGARSLCSQGRSAVRCFPAVPCAVSLGCFPQGTGTRALESPTALPLEELGLFHAPPSPVMFLHAGRHAHTSLCPAGTAEPDWSQQQHCSDPPAEVFEGCVSQTACSRHGSD